ncbi:MAG TPA: methyltransferase domain-containing protein [Anaerolineae bacterium]|nr:methyltransferase domain-containing protein [Anaerolineae bacterium]
MTGLIPRHLPTYLEQESLLTSLQKAARHTQDGLLLDIGCGSCPYVSLFPAATRYVGIDLPSKLTAYQQPAIWASGLRLPFAAKTFATVLCTQVLEHVPQPMLLLRESFRVLRVGGILILAAPQTWGLHEEPRDYYRFTKYGLQYLLESVAFEVQWIEARGGVFRMIGQTFLSFLYIRNQISGATPWLKRLTTMLNTFFVYLDRRWRWEKDTLGYTALAIRPERQVVDVGDGHSLNVGSAARDS